MKRWCRFSSRVRLHGCPSWLGGALLMVVVWTFRRPSLCRPVHRQCMRNALLDLTTIVPTTACHQRDYVETYSRCIVSSSMTHYGSYDPATPCFGVPACEDPGRFGYF